MSRLRMTSLPWSETPKTRSHGEIPDSATKEFRHVYLPRHAFGFVEAHVNAEDLRLGHVERVAGKVVKEKGIALTPGMFVGEVEIDVVVGAGRADRKAAKSARGGVPLDGCEFERTLGDVTVGGEELRDAAVFVDGQQEHGGRLESCREALAKFAVETLVPEVEGEVGLHRIEAETGEVNLLLGRRFLVAVEQAKHEPLAKFAFDPEREDFRAVALEEVDGTGRLAAGRKGLFQNRQPDRVELGEAVAGDGVAAGQRDDRRDGLRLREGAIGQADVVGVVDPGALVKVVAFGRGGRTAGGRQEVLLPVQRRLVQLDPHAVEEADGRVAGAAVEQVAVRADGGAHDLEAATIKTGLRGGRVMVALGGQETPLDEVDLEHVVAPVVRGSVEELAQPLRRAGMRDVERVEPGLGLRRTDLLECAIRVMHEPVRVQAEDVGGFSDHVGREPDAGLEAEVESFLLTIPNIPFVANVDETIAIKVTIVAPAK